MGPAVIGEVTTKAIEAPIAAATVVESAVTARISADAAAEDVLAVAGMAGDAADAVAVSAREVAVTCLLRSMLPRREKIAAPIVEVTAIAAIQTADLVAITTIAVPTLRAPVPRPNPLKSRLCCQGNRSRSIAAVPCLKLPLRLHWRSRSASNRSRNPTSHSLA
jgi:hypothetical protein